MVDDVETWIRVLYYVVRCLGEVVRLSRTRRPRRVSNQK